ncbi:MAG: glycosyltransferase family 9 protein [Gammaproteobacteria bacterium]|nr:glycosyltransferase family 9 protein [Gammaproteobacteria bacterium]
MSLNRRRPPASVCIIRLSAIGDVCHTLPVVRTLQAAWPQTRFTWIIGKTEASLLAGMPDVELVVLDKARGLPGLLELRRMLARRRFDLLLHMHASMRANLASLCVQAGARLGFDRARASDLQWLFTNERIAARTHEHVMDGLFGFADAVGVIGRVLEWNIPLTKSDRAFAGEHISEHSLIVSPCSSEMRGRYRNFRNWSAENYAAAIDYAAERYGLETLLTGGGSVVELEYGNRIETLARVRPQNLIGATTLKQLLALLERASVLICPDSGPAHMATSTGTPVIGLYGTTNPDRAGPYMSREWVVNRYPEAVAREFGKGVNELPWGVRVRKPFAMQLIQVQDVTGKLDRLMQMQGVRPLPEAARVTNP